MAKRFIDTAIFRKDFTRSLDAPHKLLWLYIINECDHAGLWDVELEVAEIRLGVKFKGDPAINFGDKIMPVDGGKKWFIPSFINFQYGELKSENRAHASVISLLKKFDLLDSNNQIKPLTSPLQGAMDMDMDKELDMDNVKEPKIQKQKSEPMDPELVSAIIPKTWDKAEFEVLLLRWSAKRKKKPDTDLAILRVSELVERYPHWMDAKKAMTEAAAEGWMKFVYTDSYKKTEPEGGRYANERGLKFDKA